MRIPWLLLLIACASPPKPAPVAPPPIANVAPPPPPPQRLDLDSTDILARAPEPEVLVKHVLVAWAELAPDYRGRLDPRAAARTQADAAKLAETIAATLRAHPESLDELIEKYSEDPGGHGDPYEVKESTQFVPEFKNLALRLKIDEAGIIKTHFGYHVIVRVRPPPPDPLESADILARPAGTEAVRVQHILIGWDQTTGNDPRAKARRKPGADELARQVLAMVRSGGDMAALITRYSEDATGGKVVEVVPDSSMIEPFKRLALRLAVDEAGLVKTPFGWHIIKRLAPPPPDPLESKAILAREPSTTTVKVKHILLSWDAIDGVTDPRGKTRDRRALEKLVKATLAKLAQGARIEPLMERLSEDPGSAKDGKSYDVLPDDKRLVVPFRDLSLRLKLNEVGVVRTVFGIHIIKRIE